MSHIVEDGASGPFRVFDLQGSQGSIPSLDEEATEEHSDTDVCLRSNGVAHRAHYHYFFLIPDLSKVHRM